MATIELKPAVAGDVNDIRTLRLDNVVGGVVESVAVVIWNVEGSTRLTANVVEQGADYIDVSVNLGGPGGWLATATATKFNVEAEVHWADGTELTWPDAPPASLTVRSDGD
jgi:hypothetical protein